jgi:hypothetical protein
VLSRHAGPGDSFLLVHQLLSVYQRRPRVVMKATLQLDPSENRPRGTAAPAAVLTPQDETAEPVGELPWLLS